MNFNEAKKLILNPIEAVYSVRAKFAAQGLWDRYLKLSHAHNVKKLYFILSFDCDTEEDIIVAWELHTRLAALGIQPVYAVPGELLKLGKDVYQKIADTGAEFINHGFTQHTYFNEASKQHASCFFYDKIGLDAVRRDIIEGDRNLKEVLNIKPQGFRAPHFGTFQKRSQLAFIHQVLQNIGGYKFSTSTMPVYGYRYGPIVKEFDLLEFPLSGSITKPLLLLDTWSCFKAPNRSMAPEDYGLEMKKLSHFFKGNVGILNYYGDPSHIINEPIFFESMKKLSEIATNISYRKLIEELR